MALAGEKPTIKIPAKLKLLVGIGALLILMGRLGQDLEPLRGALNAVSPILITNRGSISLIVTGLVVISVAVKLMVRSAQQQIAGFRGSSQANTPNNSFKVDG